MLAELLAIANKYGDGVNKVKERKEQWLNKHSELVTHLKEIADYLNTNTSYKQGFFIDTLHAFNEDMHGTCADMPSVTFRSGDMPMLLTFHNSMGERKEYIEEGFSVTFNPTITGQIVVLLQPHNSDLNKEALPLSTLAVIDEPALLTMEDVDQVISNGMEAAFYTSFTGMGERLTEGEQQQQQLHAPVPRNPIGFKRYETTQRIS